MVFCQKLQKEAAPMSFAPVPGELGQRILENISQEAWQQWIKHQTMLINEKHLNMMASAQRFLSGALSKTVNLPEDATVEDVQEVFLRGWKLGLKSIAIYRDGSKSSQPLNLLNSEIAI